MTMLMMTRGHADDDADKGVMMMMLMMMRGP